jgi:hypothetical protein
VQEGDAWVALYPLEKGRTRLSAGIDATAASPIIGKQWFSWDAAADAHYRWVVAPARTFYRSLEAWGPLPLLRPRMGQPSQSRLADLLRHACHPEAACRPPACLMPSHVNLPSQWRKQQA